MQAEKSSGMFDLFSDLKKLLRDQSTKKNYMADFGSLDFKE